MEYLISGLCKESWMKYFYFTQNPNQEKLAIHIVNTTLKVEKKNRK